MMQNPSIHLDVVVRYSQKCDTEILLPKPYICIEDLIASNFGTSLKELHCKRNQEKGPTKTKDCGAHPMQLLNNSKINLDIT